MCSRAIFLPCRLIESFCVNFQTFSHLDHHTRNCKYTNTKSTNPHGTTHLHLSTLKLLYYRIANTMEMLPGVIYLFIDALSLTIHFTFLHIYDCIIANGIGSRLLLLFVAIADAFVLLN